MLAPSVIESALPPNGSEPRLIESALIKVLVLAVIIVLWLEAYRKTYRATHYSRWVLLFLLLLPFVLCYPAWFVIAVLMSGWKGPPL